MVTVSRYKRVCDQVSSTLYNGHSEPGCGREGVSTALSTHQWSLKTSIPHPQRCSPERKKFKLYFLFASIFIRQLIPNPLGGVRQNGIVFPMVNYFLVCKQAIWYLKSFSVIFIIILKKGISPSTEIKTPSFSMNFWNIYFSFSKSFIVLPFH